MTQATGLCQTQQSVSEIGKKTGHGYTDLNKAITESSDTFFYQTAFNLGIDRFSMWMKRFGFGMPTGIEIQEEAAANNRRVKNGNKNVIKNLGYKVIRSL